MVNLFPARQVSAERSAIGRYLYGCRTRARSLATCFGRPVVIEQSVALAKRVQKGLVAAAGRLNKKTRDLGVKGSLFFVLLGARMPSILVETSFLSNPREAKLLGRADYQNALADAVAVAVKTHIDAERKIAAP